MSIASIKTGITSNFGRQVLTAQKHSPVILLGIGITGFVGTVVLAASATLKMDEVLKDHEEKVQQGHDALALGTDNYTEKDRKKDLTTLYIQTGLKVTKLYAPAVLLGAVSICAMTGSYSILNRRNVGLTAAYTAVMEGFKEYRERVVQDLGVEKDAEYRHGLIDRQIAVDTDEGPVAKTMKGTDASKTGSIYAKIFDESNPNWKKEPGYNQLFLQAQQNYVNNLLKHRGHVFLNEVYEALGMDHTKAGAVVGWVKGNGDDCIDFGVFNNVFLGREFVNGNEKSIWLDFNVDGVVYDLLGD